MSSQTSSLEVLLLGSSPFASAEEFFTKTTGALSTKLHQIPDGETGPRSNFIAWQHGTIPITIIQPRWGGQPSPESSANRYTIDDIKPTGYDDQAIASYTVFRNLKAAGKIGSATRFQVSLPTPLSVIRGFVEDDSVCAQVDPLYEQRLLQALGRIQDHIPASELVIQWDLPTEIAVLEYERGHIQDKYWKPYFAPVKEGILQRLVRLASEVGPDVEMGYHLCYGDMGRVPFVRPSDTDLLVETANAIMETVGPHHQIAYFHMPVPKDRTDEAYFRPMQSLDLRGAKLFLGLAHPHDEDGTKRRLETARSLYPHVAGIATVCGLGRFPREDVDSVLDVMASVSGA